MRSKLLVAWLGGSHSIQQHCCMLVHTCMASACPVCMVGQLDGTSSACLYHWKSAHARSQLALHADVQHATLTGACAHVCVTMMRTCQVRTVRRDLAKYEQLVVDGSVDIKVSSSRGQG